jgi:hypothetical protein
LKNEVHIERRNIVADEKPNIQIEVDPDGNMKYYPKEFHTKRGKKIIWTCDNHPFAVQFLNISPLEWTGPQHNNAGVLAGTVKNNTKFDTYMYACAVYASGQVYLDAACPAIIIDP